MPRLPEELTDPLERFQRGASMVREAVRGADAGSISRPGAEGWSIRDILVHLSDAEMVRSTRIRMILAAEEPAIFEFDEGLWKRRLHYIWRSPEAAIALFDQLRFSSTELFRQLDAKSWERVGVWPEGERVSIAELLRRGANHAEEHAAQIEALRAR
jgi:hypothetical protein